MKISFVRILAGVALLAASPPAAAPADAGLFSGPALGRAELVHRVLELNPTIEAARQTWRAATERIVQAGALDDPMLMTSIAPASVGGGERFGARIDARQRFPFPGKRRLRSEIASARAEVERGDLAAVQLQLALVASRTWDEYYLVDRALEITRDHIRLVRELKESAEAQYVVGRAAQQDPLQAEVELTHLIHDEIVLGTDRREIVARLNELLNRAPDATLPPPPSEIRLPTAEIPEAQALQAMALERRPRLAAAAARLAARRAGIELARLDFYPDFDLTSSYNSMWMTHDHRFMIGVGVSLPIRREERRAAVREAEAEAASVKSEISALEAAIRTEVERARLAVVEDRHVLALYTNRLLPAARDQVAAARSGFIADRNSFVAVVEAEKNLRSVELRYQQGVATFFTDLARLERAVGLEPLELTREMIR